MATFEKGIFLTFYIVLIFFLQFSFAFSQGLAQVDVLKSKIEEREEKIKKLEEEIKVYNQEVVKTGAEAKTLQSTLKRLDLTDNKLKKDLNLTENKIVKTSLTLEDTKSNIEETGKKISLSSQALNDTLRELREKEDITLIESFFTYNKFTDILNEIQTVSKFQKGLQIKATELRELKEQLEEKKISYENEKNKLTNLKVDLIDQKKLVEQNKKEKTVILAVTKNKESEYKKILEQKEAEKEAFEKELFEYESQLQYYIDPSKLPGAKNGILSWPLDDVYITQKFGLTNASRKLYRSGSHNGVDFRAPVGTKVKASLSGVVWGTGDTDQYKGCYSFGKWVMVKHRNGLSTIYAHLSSIRVTAGQEVNTGDIVGFSGNSGYSTGPHLHLGLYATEGVRIEKYTNSRGCKNAVMPLADIRAYLDPGLFLPS